MISSRRHRWRLPVIVGLAVGVLVVVLVHGGRREPGAGCVNRPPGVIGVDAGRWLRAAIENVPCSGTGRVSYGTKDNLGEEMAVLDPIPDRAGGYLGVYYSPFGPRSRAAQAQFRLSLARSADLIHWSRVRVLDPSGATMPTLEPIAGRAGYLLAYEKRSRRRLADFIRIRYYATRADLMRNRVAAQVDLPIRFSRYNNGTPAFLSIDWRGSLERSIIRLTFHYETATPGGIPGPDREAVGTLRGFRKWQAARDGAIDALLAAQNLHGSHGGRRQFNFAGRPWRIYEAQTRFGDFATWHVLLNDASAERLVPLSLRTVSGRYSSSFGNPTAQVLRAPNGAGQVLVVTMFVFSTGGASAHPGELVYYQPLQPG